MNTITGAELIQRERARQQTEEGYDLEHDDTHPRGDLWRAARCYESHSSTPGWPWPYSTFKLKDELSNYIRAGALYQAALDQHPDSYTYQAGIDRCAEKIDALLAKAREVLS